MRRSTAGTLAGVILTLAVCLPVVLAGCAVQPAERPVGATQPVPMPDATQPSDLGPTTPSAAPTTMIKNPSLILDGTRAVTSPTPWSSWSLTDLRTGQVWESANANEPSLGMSMTKAFIGAEFLRKHTEQGLDVSQSWRDTIDTMISVSSDDAANALYDWFGGADVFLHDMVSVCGTDGKTYISGPFGWGSAYITAHDMMLLGKCIADGTAAGPQWTGYLLDEMRNRVTGQGMFGPRLAMPADLQPLIAIKNGWWPVDGTWYVNSLAIDQGFWVLTVMTRSGSFEDGAAGCQSIAKQLEVES